MKTTGYQRLACAVAVIALPLAACGSDGADAYEGPTFPAVTDAYDYLTDNGFACQLEPDEVPSYDVTGAEGLYCWSGEEGISLDVYFSTEQQDEALPYSRDVNPGRSYVVGPLWAISTPRPDTAQEVADAMGVPAEQVLLPGE